MKIYIIDEVHMLTNEAFNALLKTLEEPPENVIFIFATTEPHKVPLTILSRCQRFDFRSIPNTEIAGYLKKVADQEKLEISEGTLYAIARKAEGSLRDALSLFDQIRAFAGGQFGERDVVAVTGMIEDEIFLKILRSISAGDGKGVVEGIGEIAGSGKDLGEFYDGLLAHLRNLILLKVNESLREVCDVPASSLEEYLRIAPLFDERILFRMFDHLAGNRVLFRNSDLKRIILETLLLRFSAGGGGGLAKAPQAEDAAEQSAGEDPGVQPASEPPAASPLPQAEETVWRTFLDQIRKKKVTLFGLLSAAKPVALKEHAFSLSMECRNSFIKDQLKLPEHVSLMNECISGICGRRVFFEIEYEKGQPAGRGHSSKPGTDPAVERLKQLLDAEEIGSGPPAGSS